MCGYSLMNEIQRRAESKLSPEHDDGGVCQWHLLNSIEEQDHGIGTNETPQHQIYTFISWTKETCPGGIEI